MRLSRLLEQLPPGHAWGWTGYTAGLLDPLTSSKGPVEPWERGSPTSESTGMDDCYFFSTIYIIVNILVLGKSITLHFSYSGSLWDVLICQTWSTGWVCHPSWWPASQLHWSSKDVLLVQAWLNHVLQSVSQSSLLFADTPAKHCTNVNTHREPFFGVIYLYNI